jgi:NADH-quinone oxidoreductase subunit N
MRYITPLEPAYPELFLLAMVCVILIADLFIRDEKRIVTYALTQLALGIAFFITLLPRLASGPEPVTTFSGMFVDDFMSDVLKLLLYLGIMTVLVYSRAYISTRGLFRGEFFVLVLFAALGMMVMISASHLLTLYLGLELFSLALYSMVALQRDSATATEAAMKYFVLGALASGMLLYGMSMLYGATGTLAISQIADLVAAGGTRDVALVFALVFIVAGLGFKLGAVPFHMWVPDVYHGAPTAVTLFIGTVPKLASFAFFMRLLVQGLGAEQLAQEWQQMLIVMAVLSLLIGNVIAIAQTNLKRMLAYSTIGHMGFLLLGILSGDVIGYGASMFYAVVYVLMNLGAFGMILLLSRDGFEAENIDDFKGLNQRSPWYAFMMLLLMFSMAGLPPTVGFYAKLSVLSAVVNVSAWWSIPLAVWAVLFSLVGAFYYLRLVKVMYFDAPTDSAPIAPRADVRLLMSANGLSMLALGIRPEWLMAVCLYSIQVSL